MHEYPCPTGLGEIDPYCIIAFVEEAKGSGDIWFC